MKALALALWPFALAVAVWLVPFSFSFRALDGRAMVQHGVIDRTVAKRICGVRGYGAITPAGQPKIDGKFFIGCNRN